MNTFLKVFSEDGNTILHYLNAEDFVSNLMSPAVFTTGESFHISEITYIATNVVVLYKNGEVHICVYAKALKE